MDVTIWGRNCEIPEPVRAAAREKVGKMSRFLDGWEHAEVHFFEERNPRIPDREVCEVTLRGHGHLIRAKAASPEALAALDLVIDKLEHQVAKLKGRLVSRSHPRRHGHSHVAAPPLAGDDSDEPEAELDLPLGPARIVKTKRFDIKPMTPEEAALQMELLAHDFYFFTNAETGQAAVVYRRQDGDVGLIEAEG